MLKRNSELRAEARAALTDHWGWGALAALIYMALSGTFSFIPLGNVALEVLLAMPLAWGMSIAFYDLCQRRPFRLETMFDGFKDYGRVMGTLALQLLYTLLWMLLLIVPGIVKGYSYAMTVYILRDEPSLSFNAAIERSMAMMQGHKAKLFWLDLSFIGWVLLCLLTCGVGFLFLLPYTSTARAAFYLDLKRQAAQSSTETQEVKDEQGQA